MKPVGKFFTRAFNKPRLNVPTVILVEGSDDGFFLDEVLTDINASPDDVGVCVADGKGNFSALLQVMLKSPMFTGGTIRRYAVIRDVDDDLQACLSECASLFSQAQEPQPAPGNFQLRSDGRYNGLFLMPGSTEVGSLETLAFRTLDNHPIAIAADSFLSASAANGGSLDHLDKRRMQAFLASRSAPLCNGVGWATRGGVFNITSNSLQQLKDFLIELQTK